MIRNSILHQCCFAIATDNIDFILLLRMYVLYCHKSRFLPRTLTKAVHFFADQKPPIKAKASVIVLYKTIIVMYLILLLVNFNNLFLRNWDN